jgi:hypothetical protein
VLDVNDIIQGSIKSKNLLARLEPCSPSILERRKEHGMKTNT